MVLSGILYEVNLLCPFKWMNVKQNKVRWYNSSLNSIAQERDRLFQAFKRGKRKNVAIYTAAISKRKEYSRAVKKCKKTFFSECLNRNRNNSKLFWKNINEVIGTTEQPDIGRVFRPGTTYLCSEQESAEVINEFFASVGERVL